MIRTILFDMDGTLVDTEPAAARAVKERFDEWGVPVAPRDAEYVTGRTWASAIDFLMERYRLPVSRDEAIDRILERYRELLDEELRVIPGSVEAVRSLAEAGRFGLGLVSGSGRAEILRALKKLGILECFQAVLGAEDYPRSKPAPDGYLKALRLLGGESGSGLVFEDSHAGIASARAAGLWVVAVTGSNHFGQDNSGAHWHVEDLRGIDAEWILRLKPVVS